MLRLIVFCVIGWEVDCLIYWSLKKPHVCGLKFHPTFAILKSPVPKAQRSPAGPTVSPSRWSKFPQVGTCCFSLLLAWPIHHFPRAFYLTEFGGNPSSAHNPSPVSLTLQANIFLIFYYPYIIGSPKREDFSFLFAMDLTCPFINFSQLQNDHF